MRILLTEGSGLTARQVATRLGQLGHEVELLSSTPLCLARFTRHVRGVHQVPPFGLDPKAWFAAAKRVLDERGIQMLFPTQEQVAWLAAHHDEIRAMTVLPSFSALRRVQDKIAAFQTLKSVELPQPPGRIVREAAELRAIERFPVFVKRATSTASNGVRRAANRSALASAVAALGPGDLLVQESVSGPLVMAQAVADDGRLIALHANLRVREGVGGGAAVKESIRVPGLAKQVQRLVERLHWHGPISFDLILTEADPVIIDINPRLVEPMNAWLSGVDLVGSMLALARGEHPPVHLDGCQGVRSRQILLALLGAAQRERTRLAVWHELRGAIHGVGDFRDAVEELTPCKNDWLAAFPVLAVAAATLVWPGAWRHFESGAVQDYALTPAAWEQLRATAGGN